MSKFKIPTEENLITSKDEKIIFDEKQHIYYYNEKPLISVTQFIKLYTPEFNALFASNSKAKKNKENNKTNSTNEITDPILLRKYWKLISERSTNLGTAAHIFSQLYCLNRNIEPKTKFDEAVSKAINDLEKEWDIVSQEEIVYNLDYMMAGSIDLILKHKKTKEYWIADWKTTEDMEKSYGKLLKPFDNFNNNALTKYSIQLDLYSLMCNFYIPHNNKMIIQLKNTGEFVYYDYNNINKRFKLPYTYDKTKESLEFYKKLN